MRRILSIFNSKKIPVACLLCVATLLVLEFIVRRHIDVFRTGSDKLQVKKDRYMRESTEDFDCVIFGDSRALGFHAKYLEEQVTKDSEGAFTAYNFAFPNQGVQSYYFLLKKYLALGKKPKIVILSIAPATLESVWNLSNPGHPDRLYRFARMFSLADAWEAGGADILFKVLRIKAEYLSNFVTYRSRIAKLLAKEALIEDPLDNIGLALRQERGSVLVSGVNTPTLEEITASEFFTRALVVDTHSLYWVDRFFDLADRSGIRVIIMAAPLIDPVYNAGEANGTNAVYTQIMHAFRSRYDQVSLVEPLLEAYPVTYFADVQHLNEAGRAWFTAAASERIVEMLK